MNKFLNTYISYRKKSYIHTISLYKTNEWKYYNLSDYKLYLSLYKLTSSSFDSNGFKDWWISFLNDGYIWNLFMFKTNKIKIKYYFDLNNKIKKNTYE